MKAPLAKESVWAVAPTFASAGPAGAPSIVFLHGAAFTRAMWLPQMERLSDEFRVIALDLPGHGQRDNRPFRLDDAVRDATRLIDEQAGGRALVVGLSLGGYLAMALARQSPRRVVGLVLAGCSVDYRGLLGGLARLNALLLRIYPTRWLTSLNKQTLRRMLPPALAEAQIAAGFWWRAAGQGIWAVAGKDFRAMLRAYPGPVLVLNGEHDRRNRAGEAVLVAAASHGALRVLANAGHGCNLEQPEDFTEAVRTFAREYERFRLV